MKCPTVGTASACSACSACSLRRKVVVMDLEDSVAIGEKEVARKNVIQALKDHTGRTVIDHELQSSDCRGWDL